MQAEDWHHGRALVLLLREGEDRVALAVNGADVALPLGLPAPRAGYRWRLLADSAAPERVGEPTAATRRAQRAVAGRGSSADAPGG
jgi:pullulanase/glycogen debranching enzyme